MKQFGSLLLLLLAGCLSLIYSGHAAEEIGWEIRAQNPEGEVEFDPKSGLVTAPKGIIITYRDVVLTAQRATANQQTGEVLGEGSVTVKGRDHVWTGDRVRYNFITGELHADSFKTGHEPFFLYGEGLNGSLTNGIYSITNAFVTTDNVTEPGQRIRAQSITVVPGKYFVARGATLYLGEVPVFYFPYYRRTLGPHPNNFSFAPGFRSLDGAYLLTTYNWYLSEQFDGGLHFDVRTRRGLAGGPDLNFHLGPLGDGSLRYYIARDDDPPLDQNLKPVPDNRQRLHFSHQAIIRSNLTFKADVNYQTDPSIIRDFFESEYRQNVQPRTFAEVNQIWPNWTLDVLAQPRINDFFETVERLPDVKLTGFRQQLGVSPLYYDGESSMGYYHRRFADDALPDFAAYRLDSFHQFTLPLNFFGWLNFTPRVGGRFTYYSEADESGATTFEQTRGVFNTGAEVSLKASRVWKNASSKLFDVTELRHIIEPSINYVFVPHPSVLPRDLPQFDYEVRGLRPLPIEFPEYNAVDAIDSENVLRFTLVNRLQTKRADGIENLVNWSLFTDWRLKPRPGQATFSDVYSDLALRPRTWFGFNSQTRFSIGAGRFLEADHRAVLRPNSVWSVSLGHRYLGDDPAFGPNSGHNLIYDRFYYRFNENWGARISHYFEARDGVMEEQYYSLYRDMRSWTAALTFRHRQNRAGRPDDYTIAVTISLKAFPRFKLDSDSDRPEVLTGG
jgi:hypothetical protein